MSLYNVWTQWGPHEKRKGYRRWSLAKRNLSHARAAAYVRGVNRSSGRGDRRAVALPVGSAPAGEHSPVPQVYERGDRGVVPVRPKYTKGDRVNTPSLRFPGTVENVAWHLSDYGRAPVYHVRDKRGVLHAIPEESLRLASGGSRFGRSRRDPEYDYVLLYGRATSRPHKLEATAIREAKALSERNSYGGEVTVVRREGHRTVEIGRARDGWFHR